MHPLRAQAAFLARKPTLYKVRVVFSKPVHVVRSEGGPPSANHGPFKAKPSSHHVHVTLWVRASTQRLSFLRSARCDVIKSTL